MICLFARPFVWAKTLQPAPNRESRVNIKLLLAQGTVAFLGEDLLYSFMSHAIVAAVEIVVKASSNVFK